MEQRNIILIGMPGSGKSTLGVLLAKAINYRFLDTDLLIQEREGKLLREIIAEKGQEAFLKIEEEVNAGVNVKRTVIAPGGSAVYSERAMRHFAEIGTIVYLHVPLQELEKRLGDLTRRGVVLKQGQTLGMLFEERRPYYERYAEVTVDVAQEDIGMLLAEIMEKLEQRKEERGR